jgi:hypothetical protein
MIHKITNHPAPLFKRLYHALPGVSTLLIALVLAACASQEAPPTATAPELNLDTLEAEMAFGTLQAQRAETSFVAALGEGQAIGITFFGETTQEVLVLLYDRACVAIMQGELNAEGRASLTSEEPTDFEATVDITVANNTASGTVSLMGETSAFSAEAATGISGVYRARGTHENPDVSAEWVVLPDERQWGCICTPPWVNPCCKIIL